MTTRRSVRKIFLHLLGGGVEMYEKRRIKNTHLKRIH
jgi:hypothetical protein